MTKHHGTQGACEVCNVKESIAIVHADGSIGNIRLCGQCLGSLIRNGLVIDIYGFEWKVEFAADGQASVTTCPVRPGREIQ